MLEIKQSQLSHIVSRRTPDTENFLLFGERERKSLQTSQGEGPSVNYCSVYPHDKRMTRETLQRTKGKKTECQLLFGVPPIYGYGINSAAYNYFGFRFKPLYLYDLGSFRNDFKMACNASTPSKRKADGMTASMYSPSPKKAKVLTLMEQIQVLEKSDNRPSLANGRMKCTKMCTSAMGDHLS